MAPPPGLMLCEFFDSGGLASDADGLAQSDTAAEIPAESGDDAERGRGQEDEKQVLPQKCFHDPPPDDDCPLGPKRRSTSVMIRLASGARICPRFTRTPSTSTIIREISPGRQFDDERFGVAHDGKTNLLHIIPLGLQNKNESQQKNYHCHHRNTAPTYSHGFFPLGNGMTSDCQIRFACDCL